MDQNNRVARLPNLHINIQQPRMVQLQPSEAEAEANASMMFHRILGVLDHDYCGEALELQLRHFQDPLGLRNAIRNLQLQYANDYVAPHLRAAVRLASDLHYQAVLRRDNAAINNNQ